jgi:hypothetical protein
MSEEPGPEGQPQRRRPIGGAAAWRRVEEPPLRAAHDDSPEDTRYRHASFSEQARDAWSGFIHNRALVGVVLVLVGGWIALRLLTPTPVTLDELKPGDCLYVRAGDPDVGPPVGTAGEVQARLADAGAEYAECGLSHSHEVVGVVPVPGDAPWPGLAALHERADPACDDAFGALPAGWREVLDLVVVVPSEAGWADGGRLAACLVQRADRAFLDRPAR